MSDPPSSPSSSFLSSFLSSESAAGGRGVREMKMTPARNGICCCSMLNISASSPRHSGSDGSTIRIPVYRLRAMFRICPGQPRWRRVLSSFGQRAYVASFSRSLSQLMCASSLMSIRNTFPSPLCMPSGSVGALISLRLEAPSSPSAPISSMSAVSWRTMSRRPKGLIASASSLRPFSNTMFVPGCMNWRFPSISVLIWGLTRIRETDETMLGRLCERSRIRRSGSSASITRCDAWIPRSLSAHTLISALLLLSTSSRRVSRNDERSSLSSGRRPISTLKSNPSIASSWSASASSSSPTPSLFRSSTALYSMFLIASSTPYPWMGIDFAAPKGQACRSTYLTSPALASCVSSAWNDRNVGVPIAAYSKTVTAPGLLPPVPVNTCSKSNTPSAPEASPDFAAAQVATVSLSALGSVTHLPSTTATAEPASEHPLASACAQSCVYAWSLGEKFRRARAYFKMSTCGLETRAPAADSTASY
mmetsp:Transcript_45415/g.108390  ORF Transcript_45415/g.108390 Transcript_45415/m.108390 type:complete len:478 (-) Transcript_45415:232-1665(-)